MSIVRIPPRNAIHPKATTLGDAFNFEILPRGLGKGELLSRTEKNEETESTPSCEALHTLLATPISEMCT